MRRLSRLIIRNKPVRRGSIVIMHMMDKPREQRTQYAFFVFSRFCLNALSLSLSPDKNLRLILYLEILRID